MEKFSQARGERLVGALIGSLTLDRGLREGDQPLEVLVSDDGDSRIEHLRR